MITSKSITELLKNVKVEWKSLGEITEIANNNRKPVKAASRISGNIPYYGANNIQDYVAGHTHNGEYVLIAEDGSSSLENYSIQWVTGKFWANNHVHVIQGKKGLNNRFLFHFLTYMDFNPYLTGGTRAKLTKAKLVEIPIPIPPLNIQKEIARILDTFTTMTAELTAELNIRKQQYNYYRDKLLTFKENEVEWQFLGESLVRTKGTKITAEKMKQLHKEGASIKIFAGGKTLAFVDPDDIPLQNVNKEPSIIVKSRGIIEFEFYNKPFTHKNEMWSYHSTNKNINIKYVYYYLKTKEVFFQNIGSRMQMPQIAITDTDNFKIPIPPLSEQKRIVEILDKFDSLTNSITEGLPREIELRQKQYEYYRNLLLDFPRVNE